jgi:phosphoglycerol transferase MdoB-like AlkP superfamily enzyme
MKKLLLLFIALTTLASVSYASFPITENTTELTADNFVIDDGEEGKEPSLILKILGMILFLIFLFGSFLLLRAWWRAWRDRVRWVRRLTKVLLIIVGVLTVLTIICSIEGCVYNMQ